MPSKSLFPEAETKHATNQAGGLVALSELAPGQEADFFALLSAKEELRTRDQKPYHRVTFRDFAREVSFPIWGDSPWSIECRDQWKTGEFYKLRATYRETNFGPQLEIRRIRPVNEADAADGFTPAMCAPQSRFDSQAMLIELRQLAETEIHDPPLKAVVLSLLSDYESILLTLPAATRNHHAYRGGYLEHVLSVSKTCVYLAHKYAEYYPDMEPPLRTELVVAGGILHDIGKVREIEESATGAEYTASGNLIGHMLQGRDLVREAGTRCKLDPETMLRLEHIVISHQRLPEWGAPKPPMTPEALLVHYADDADAKMNMMFAVLRDDTSPGPCTTQKNLLYQKLYKGPVSEA